MLYLFPVLICVTRPCNVSWHVTVRYKSSFIVIIIVIILRPRARRLPPDRHEHDTDDRWTTGARLMASWPKRDSASAHFGAKCQITIHTAVIYRKDGHKSFASISDSLCHDPVAIRTHMKPVLLELRQLHPQVTDVHFFLRRTHSTGTNRTFIYCQHRSAGWQVTLCDPMWHVSSRSGLATLRTAIHLLLTYLQTGVSLCYVELLASGHSNGAPDAIGGAVKRQADAMVSMNDAEKLVKCLQKTDSVIRFNSYANRSCQHRYWVFEVTETTCWQHESSAAIRWCWKQCISPDLESLHLF